GPVVARAAVADVPAGAPAPRESAVGTAAVPATDAATVVPDPPKDPPKNPPRTFVTLASLFTSDPAKEDPKPAVRPLDTPDECLVPDICIDEYLWSLYQRAP